MAGQRRKKKKEEEREIVAVYYFESFNRRIPTERDGRGKKSFPCQDQRHSVTEKRTDTVCVRACVRLVLGFPSTGGGKRNKIDRLAEDRVVGENKDGTGALSRVSSTQSWKAARLFHCYHLITHTSTFPIGTNVSLFFFSPRRLKTTIFE